MVWAEDLMAGRMGDEVLAASLVGLASKCRDADALDFDGAVSFVAALARVGVTAIRAASWLGAEEVRAAEATAVERHGCDGESVVAKEARTMDVKKMMGVKTTRNEGKKMLVDEVTEIGTGLAAWCGSVATGAPVVRVWCAGDWMCAWEMHRKWWGEMLMRVSAERASVLVGVTTRMVLEAVAGCVGILRFSLICLDHIAVDGLGGEEAAEAADDGMVVASVLVEEQ